MKFKTFILAVSFFFPVSCFGDTLGLISPISETSDEASFWTGLRRLQEQTLSWSGGDDVFYIDRKNLKVIISTLTVPYSVHLSTSSGKVGIGTTNPLALLDVAGSIYFGPGTVAGDKQQLSSDAAGGSGRWISPGSLFFQAGGGSLGKFQIGGTFESGTQVFINASGDVGISTGIPQARLDVAGNITTSGTVKTKGIVGTTTNDSANTGNVGETQTSAVTSNANFPATGDYGDLTSISLTAGDWLVFAQLKGNTATSATTTNFAVGISANSGNSTTGLSAGDNWLFWIGAALASNDQRSITIAGYRVSLASTTTYYLKYAAIYSSGQPVATGRLTAVRIR